MSQPRIGSNLPLHRRLSANPSSSNGWCANGSPSGKGSWGILSSALLLAAAGPCGTAPAPAPTAPATAPATTAPATPTTSLTAASKDKAVPADLYTSVGQLVDTVAALPVLSKSAFEGLLGVPLRHLPEQPPEYLYYEAQLPTGPFSRVEVREANPKQKRFELAFFEVRPGVELDIASFYKDGRVDLNMGMNVNPDIPPEGTLSFSRRSAEQSVHYQFTARSKRLTLVAFHRPAD